MTRQKLLSGLVLATLWLAAGAAPAQINPFKGNGPKLQQGDIALMDKAAAPLFTGGGYVVGTKNDWSNPASGWSGSVTAVGTETRKGLACRVLDYDFLTPKRESERTLRLIWCQTKDGTWKFE